MNESSPPVTLATLRAPIEADMAEVDRVILQRLASEVVLIRQIAGYIIESGGKRLRPALVLLAANAFGAQGGAKHEMAAVIEFIHTATLLHDDVVDESTLRRGRNTANAEFGNSASVLVGDFLYSRAFQMMVDVGDIRIMRVMANATNVVAEGEVLQLLNVNDADTDEDAYLRVIRYKTAKLFEAATETGAILGRASDEQVRALANYGMHLGTAFQLVDDILDYSGDLTVTGKNIGDDLAEGKPTLPLIHVMREGTADQREVIRRAIEGDGKSDLEAVLAAIEATGALAYAKRRSQQESALATSALAAIPDSPCRDSLLQLAHFSVERKF